MTTATTHSVELKAVTKRFGEVVAVDRVDLQVRRGEFFSLLGPSGCGKTTTLRMIGGLEHPNEGDIFINEQRVNDTPPYERDSSIVFQNLALFPHMSVAQNIAFGLKLQRIPKAQIRTKVTEMLELVQLSGMERRRPDQLSGGQQQRVALARSLVLEPEVLLLDEPLAALDRKLRKEMQAELRRIQRDVGITFVYVTHDQKEALSMSDRIAVMKGGIIVQLGPPEEIYQRPRTRFVADFMGAANVFAGRGTVQGDRLRLTTANGLQVSALGVVGVEGAEDLGFSVRPEAIRLHRSGEGLTGDNVFEGTVRSLMYFGEVIEVEVALGCGDRLICNLGTTAKVDALAEGQRVWVSWAAADSNALVG